MHVRKDADGLERLPDTGRDAMPWSTVPAAHAFVVGDVIYSGNSPEPGTVVSVDADEATMAVKWRDVGGAIIYPLDATYLRKAYPWE